VTGRTPGRPSIRHRRAWLAVASLYLLLAIGIGVPFTWRLVSPVTMAVIAHSGDVMHWPRDSMPAIVSAARSGADGIEFDVNRSAIGTWWLFHDDDVTAGTTGTGSLQEMTDAEIATLRIDGGMGYDPLTQADAQPLPQLSDVLDALEGYAGTLIVDCKDKRPGAHRELAAYLAGRGLYPSIIARGPEAAAEVKSVDERLTVITQQLTDYDANVDTWLASATAQVTPVPATVADLFGSIGMFVGDDFWRQDERPYLDNGRRWGASFVITNDIQAALAWRASLDR
jgi:Glycerophosphoryl diester phosphodiesterase family